MGHSRTRATAALERWESGSAGGCRSSDDALYGPGRGHRDRGRGGAGALPESARTDIEDAFRLYEEHRKPRTSRIQAISSANTWMRGGDEDTTWLYGYDAWNVPLPT